MEDLLRADIPPQISFEVVVELFQSLIILETSYLFGASLLEASTFRKLNIFIKCWVNITF